jgi:hypothetical protein
VREAAAWQGWQIEWRPDWQWKAIQDAADADPRRGREWSDNGWPDITLWHVTQQRLVFVELKTERGTVRPEQRERLISLAGAGSDVRIWRPSQGDEIIRFLAGAPNFIGCDEVRLLVDGKDRRGRRLPEPHVGMEALR